MLKSALLIFLFSLLIYAQDSWEEAIPTAKEYDWVQTKSGEWLKGEFKGMYNEELEFDSDEFGLQSIDFEDVKRLISKSFTSLYIEGRGVISGRLYLNDGYIFLTLPDETIKLERDKIVSMTNGADEESSYWSGNFSLGFSLSSGNTQKKEISTQLHIKRQTANSRFLFNNLGNYTENFGVETENNQRLTSSIDIFQTRHFFIRPAFVEYSRDPFQNIENKYTVGLGLGYDLVSSAKINLTVFLGPAYQSTTFVDVLEGTQNPVTTPVILFTSDYDHEVTKNIDLILKYQAYFVNEDSGRYIHHAIATIKTEFIGDFDLDYSFLWDRIEKPTQDAEGTLPEKDDFKSILSLAYSF